MCHTDYFGTVHVCHIESPMADLADANASLMGGANASLIARS